jgi:hypothetical protein
VRRAFPGSERGDGRRRLDVRASRRARHSCNEERALRASSTRRSLSRNGRRLCLRRSRFGQVAAVAARLEPASGHPPRAAWARSARETSPGPGERQRRARDGHRCRAAVPVPTMRRGHDGSARWALCTTPPLGVGHRPGALPVWADGALDWGDPAARLHLAIGLRPQPLDDAPAVDGGRERRRSVAPHQSACAGKPRDPAPSGTPTCATARPW